MILPDINLLVFSYNADALQHAAAKKWLESIMSGTVQVSFPWVVLHGFLRIMTHPRVMEYQAEVHSNDADFSQNLITDEQFSIPSAGFNLKV